MCVGVDGRRFLNIYICTVPCPHTYMATHPPLSLYTLKQTKRTGGGLVQEDELRGQQQLGGDGEPLALAAGDALVGVVCWCVNRLER